MSIRCGEEHYGLQANSVIDIFIGNCAKKLGIEGKPLLVLTNFQFQRFSHVNC